MSNSTLVEDGSLVIFPHIGTDLVVKLIFAKLEPISVIIPAEFSMALYECIADAIITSAFRRALYEGIAKTFVAAAFLDVALFWPQFSAPGVRMLDEFFS